VSATAIGSASGTASFRVQVTPDDAIAFATLSGDWNPLHTDPAHAARTTYRRPVLHGAFSAGLLSRMAGMYLPGTDCLIHGIRLRFIAPIVPPASLVVEGRVASESSAMGHVDVTISDADTGARYVDGGYEYSRHEVEAARAGGTRAAPAADETILVTGASGGLGRAVLDRLGAQALGISRGAQEGVLHAPDLERIRDVARETLGNRRLRAIVHCAWPAPDNQRLTALANVDGAVEHNLAAPIRQVIALAQLLAERGTDDATLVLVGSTAAEPGRHNYRMPLYTLAKSLVPEITRVLAVELATTGRRCVALTFDVIEGGMNKRVSPAVRAMHADRQPSGLLPSPDDAAAQIAWVLGNTSFLLSGATIDVTGAAIP
jgi:acyl dehydratase/NAD(P)-dependent dehydrogenase (short-subunit alcohol dehydrogenase family)